MAQEVQRSVADLQRVPLTLQDLAKTTKLPLHEENLSLQEIRQRGGAALLQLRNPSEFITLAGVDANYAFLDGEVVDLGTLSSRYTGKALVLGSKRDTTSLAFDRTVWVVKAASNKVRISEQVSVLNRGNKPISIKVESTSCGCTTAGISSNSLAPGATTTLRLEMNAEGLGSKTENVVLQTSDPLWPRVVLTLQAILPKNVSSTPHPLVLNLSESKAASRVAVLQLSDKAEVVEVTASNPLVNATLTTREVVPGGAQQRVQVSVAGEMPTGPFSEELVFHLRNADANTFVLKVTGTVAPDIVASPGQLFIGRVASGAHVRTTAILESKGGKPFAVRSSSIRSGNYHLRSKFDSSVVAAAHAVELELSITGQAGALVEDVVDFTLSTGKKLSLPVLGMIVKGNAPAQGGAAGTIASVSTIKEGERPHGLLAVSDTAPDFNKIRCRRQHAAACRLAWQEELTSDVLPQVLHWWLRQPPLLAARPLRRLPSRRYRGLGCLC